MNPVDPTAPVLPSHLVRRPDKKGQRRETVPGDRRKQKPKLPAGHKSGDPDHLIDELA